MEWIAYLIAGFLAGAIAGSVGYRRGYRRGFAAGQKVVLKGMYGVAPILRRIEADMRAKKIELDAERARSVLREEAAHAPDYNAGGD